VKRGNQWGRWSNDRKITPRIPPVQKLTGNMPAEEDFDFGRIFDVSAVGSACVNNLVKNFTKSV
jgi:hypothetical protein